MVQKIALFDPLRPALLVARGVARTPFLAENAVSWPFVWWRRTVRWTHRASRTTDWMPNMVWERGWVHRAARRQVWGGRARTPLAENGGPPFQNQPLLNMMRGVVF